MNMVTFIIPSVGIPSARIGSKHYTITELAKMKCQNKLHITVLKTLRRSMKHKENKCESCNGDCGGVCFNK